MNTSKFMDKQIMDLSRTKSGSDDFVDLMNPPPPAEDQDEDTPISAPDSAKKKPHILPSYDFHPICPTSASGLSSLETDFSTAMGGDSAAAAGSKVWGSGEINVRAPSPTTSYNFLHSLEDDKVVMEKSQKVNGAEILSEIDIIMKKHTDNLLHAIDGLSARLSQLESRTRQIDHSTDDLKESIGDNYGNTDGKMRQLEHMLREVQCCVLDLKDKQEVLDAQMHLAKLGVPKVEQTVESQSLASNVDSISQQMSSCAPSQPQYLAPSTQSSNLSIFPLDAPPPLQHPIHSLPSQPPTNQYPLNPSLQQQEAYYPPSGQSQEVPVQQYLLSLAQQQSIPLSSDPQHQQYQFTSSPASSYQQALQAPQHQVTPTGIPSPQFQPLVRNCSDETTYIPSRPSRSFPLPNISQPPSSLTGGLPLPSQQYYGAPPSQMYDFVPSGRSNSRFPSQAYALSPSVLTSELYLHSGSPTRYGGGVLSMKPMHHSLTSGSNYPHIHTARPLTQVIPTTTSIGSSSSGTHLSGSGNRVPIEDVIDKVTNMGFPRDHVRATVLILTENGQSVDLNVVLDKLMNEGDG